MPRRRLRYAFCTLLATSLLVAAASTACDRPASGPEGPSGAEADEPKTAADEERAPSDESSQRPTAPGDEAAEGEAGEPTLDEDQTCVSACMDARKMQSMGADAIEFQCRQDCTACSSECMAAGGDEKRCAAECLSAMLPPAP